MEETPRPTPILKKSSGSIAHSLVVGMLLIVIGIMAGYILRSNQTNLPQPTPTVTPTSANVTPSQMSTISTSPIVTQTATLVTYTSTQLANNALKPYTLKYPDSWTKVAKKDDVSDTLTLSKDTYKIIIFQAAYGGGGCTFEGDVAPMSQDLRSKQTVTIDSGIGILKRYQADDAQSKPGIATYAFCGTSNGKDFGKPTSVGILTYETPPAPAPSMLSEMDSIVKTLTAK